jgi:hypothetical protein
VGIFKKAINKRAHYNTLAHQISQPCEWGAGNRILVYRLAILNVVPQCPFVLPGKQHVNISHQATSFLIHYSLIIITPNTFWAPHSNINKLHINMPHIITNKWSCYCKSVINTAPLNLSTLTEISHLGTVPVLTHMTLHICYPQASYPMNSRISFPSSEVDEARNVQLISTQQWVHHPHTVV